jgi:hypothetical protein
MLSQLYMFQNLFSPTSFGKKCTSSAASFKPAPNPSKRAERTITRDTTSHAANQPGRVSYPADRLSWCKQAAKEASAFLFATVT